MDFLSHFLYITIGIKYLYADNIVMNKIRFTFIIMVCWVVTAYSANAHVTMVYPVGGEIFMPGSEITIEWRRNVQHAQMNWDLFFSSDAGLTWQTIRMDIPEDQFTFEWTVPKTTAATMTGRIRIVQDNAGMNYEAQSFDFTIEVVAVAIDRPGELPDTAELLSAYPNPFSSTATVEFNLSGAGHVTLEVFDIQGKKVAVLLNRSLASGRHSVSWIADEHPAGVYFYRITTGNFVENRKILLIH